jgi:Histidine kinase
MIFYREVKRRKSILIVLRNLKKILMIHNESNDNVILRYNSIVIAEQLNRLTSSVLVHTTQMAYVEEAAGTLAILEDFTTLFRYLTRETKSISLEVEWGILEKYIHLQTIRYPGRFEIDIDEINKYRNLYIYSGMILEFFDHVLTALLDSSESFFKLNIYIKTGISHYFETRITTNLYQNIKHKQLELPHDL